MRDQFYHLHLISDATGETLRAVSRAASAQYAHSRMIEHVHPGVRSERQLSAILERIEDQPGIVLYTLVNADHSAKLEAACDDLHVPAYNVLLPVFDLFHTYLGSQQTRQVAAQHSLDAGYFRRLEALNYTMSHDDGQSLHSIEKDDIIILGISRTTKTPTSLYLAQRSLKVANIPIVSNLPIPITLEQARHPLIIGLVASPQQIMQVRQHRVLGLKSDQEGSDYLNRILINEEIAYTRRICQTHQWPLLDVTRKSIEETAAEIFKLYQRHRHHAEKPLPD
ncbi:pyruvate, water dikinase regulatory protein [uncultured Cohaesibacter sp.]|uniref:pyruvate, water dikinase regulatory protein n=1 Tax=uncultured Cohaesibacter sp. TaxID=1002546 RepID=UPI0029C8B86D|nr:pyruvate, water dikinase regulatory protein [uncultured Cohaesibacter sp.]